MWCTNVLREEHAWILRLVRCLERLAAGAEARGRLEAEGAAEVLALLVHFADGLHQEREERCLFPRLLARARSVEERQQVGRLCGDHEQERQALERLGKELLGAVYGRARSLEVFVREARRYAELHREHVAQENSELLALSEARLTAQDDAQVVEGFARLEQDPAEARTVFLRIEALCRRLGVDTPVAS